VSARNLVTRLDHVRWLGGGSGAGKTTIARQLAERHGLSLYDTDLAIADHVRRSDAGRHPRIHEFLGMSMDERWLTRTPAAMFESFWAFRGEAFEMIVDDLLGKPRDVPTVVEGFRLLPRLVLPLLSRRDHAVWLLPSPAFRRRVFETRGSTDAIVSRTSDRRRALENLLERDALFTEAVTEEAEELALQVIPVEVGMPVDATLERVAVALGLEPV
jgi:hypothetical protein